MANALYANSPHGIFYILIIFVKKEDNDKDIKDSWQAKRAEDTMKKDG